MITWRPLAAGTCCLLALALSGCFFQSQPQTATAVPVTTQSAISNKTSDDSATPSRIPEETTPSTTGAGASPVELQILDFEGIQKLIASHKGKVVVLDCWSTFCGPCIKEFPGLVDLHKKYPDDVACISVSFNYDGIGKPEDQREDVLKFLQGKGATFDNVLASIESDELSKKFEIAAIPVVFVYDRDGNLAKKFDNSEIKSEAEAFTYEKDVDPLVAELVASKAGQ